MYQNVFRQIHVPKQIVPTVAKRQLLVVLPFLEVFSLNMRKRLFKSVRKSLPVIMQYNSYFSVEKSIQ